jgi:hypothetical protein
MNSSLRHFAFFTGLAAVCWVGIGSVGANPLALAVTALIAAAYLAGALELQRFHAATAALAAAVAELPETLPALRPWLERLPAALRNAVRRRIEGEPAGLPGPAMAPYLAGLLVLLGMLGTFLGMVLTLRGTGLALDSASDLQAVRGSLVAPVKGLGLAFGTSVAGVAASAALGLMSALCRRERLQALQALDGRIATTLRPFSVVHQREESLRHLQRQAELMPALVDRLQAMTEAVERQAQAANAQLLERQERFQADAQAAYAGLAASVDRSLQASLAEGARIAGATLRPVVEATLGGVARETAALHASLGATMQRQLDELCTRFDASHAGASAAWDSALARQEQGQHTLVAELAAAHERFAGGFEQRSAALLAQVGRGHADWQQAMSETSAGMTRDAAALQRRLADDLAARLDGVTARLAETADRVTGSWQDALARQEAAGEQLADRTQLALAEAAASFERHGAGLLATVTQAHAELQARADARDGRSAAAWTQSLEALAATLRDGWRAAGDEALERQQRLADAMAASARESGARAEAHAAATTAEIARLLQAAAEAPRAAAEVIGELRAKLSDSMARDNALLDERARMLETLGTLLAAVNQAAGEQRGAIDALVGSSAALLDRVGSRFVEQVDAEAGKLAAVAAQVTGSAVEVASLGEAFGFAVELFSQASDKLAGQLQRIEGALGSSLARSDEQLAYYVAQAREVVDLSILSQRQILEDLHRIAGRPAPAEALAR